MAAAKKHDPMDQVAEENELMEAAVEAETDTDEVLVKRLLRGSRPGLPRDASVAVSALGGAQPRAPARAPPTGG